jgi:hypothetical protein
MSGSRSGPKSGNQSDARFLTRGLAQAVCIAAGPTPPSAMLRQMNEMLALAERHVITGRKIVARQRELVRRLEASGRDAALEKKTLDLLEQTLKIFEGHLRGLTAGK